MVEEPVNNNVQNDNNAAPEQNADPNPNAGGDQGGGLSWLGNNWNQPAQGISSIFIAIASYFQPPPEGIALGSTEGLLTLARAFIVPVVWLIASVPARMYAEKRHTLPWFIVAIVMFVMALGTWIMQAHLYQSWTCHSILLNKHFIYGKTFLPEVIDSKKIQERMDKEREISDKEALALLQRTPPEKLIEGAMQNPELVWERGEIRFRRLILTILYIIGVPIFVVSLISALQAWYCAGRPDGVPPAPPAPATPAPTPPPPTAT